MKQLSVFSFSLLFLLTLTFCGSRESARHDDHGPAAASSDEWPAFDSFHMVMAEAYHPYKDSSNLAPFKLHAAHMAAEAAKWAAEPLPDKVNSEEMKSMIEKLKTDAAALAARVSTGDPDEAVGADLEALHTHFHHIQEVWYKK
jgi:hypothetical protein